MIINSPKLIDNGKEIKISSLIEYSGKQEELWYLVERKYADFLMVEKLDAFLVGTILLAMKNKEDIYINGTISEKLFYNLTNYFSKILTLLIPSLHQVQIIPQDLDNGKIYHNLDGVATGFSGGIDSFCTFIDHFNNNIPKSYLLTHLVFNNVGSHGSGGRNLFQKRYQRLLNFAQEFQLDYVKIDSNLDELLQMDFRNTHTTRNVSAILLLQKLFSKYFYASAHKYQDCVINESPDGAVIDPAGIHLLSTEITELISTGCQYSRVEKTIKVADFEPSYRYLDVCVHSVDVAENCSQCWKCARTMLTLEILGKLHCYNKVFNLDKFAQIRDNYIASILHSQKPLEKEVIDLAMERGFELF
jgi:hypothetical protein